MNFLYLLSVPWCRKRRVESVKQGYSPITEDPQASGSMLSKQNSQYERCLEVDRGTWCSTNKHRITVIINDDQSGHILVTSMDFGEVDLFPSEYQIAEQGVGVKDRACGVLDCR